MLADIIQVAPVNPFKRLTRQQSRLRLAIDGPSGSGKTFTALRIARGLSDKPAAMIDTEAHSADLYGSFFHADAITLKDHSPQSYIKAIADAEAFGYEVIIIDSLTHEWVWTLEDVDRRSANARNKFTAWAEPSRQHKLLVEAMLQTNLHVIATIRSEMDYAIDGASVKKLGMAPTQRKGMEYEFTILMDMDLGHNGTISKSRIFEIADKVYPKPGEELGKFLREWLSEGTPIAPRSVTPASLLAAASADAPRGVRDEDEDPRSNPVTTADRTLIQSLGAKLSPDGVKAFYGTALPSYGFPVTEPLLEQWRSFVREGGGEPAGKAIAWLQQTLLDESVPEAPVTAHDDPGAPVESQVA